MGWLWIEKWLEFKKTPKLTQPIKNTHQTNTQLSMVTQVGDTVSLHGKILKIY